MACTPSPIVDPEAAAIDSLYKRLDRMDSISKSLDWMMRRMEETLARMDSAPATVVAETSTATSSSTSSSPTPAQVSITSVLAVSPTAATMTPGVAFTDSPSTSLSSPASSTTPPPPTPTPVDSSDNATFSSSTTRELLQAAPTRCSTICLGHDKHAPAPGTAASAPVQGAHKHAQPLQEDITALASNHPPTSTHAEVVFDEMHQRYIVKSTSAYSIGVVPPCLATKVQDAHKVWEGMSVLNSVMLEPWSAIVVDLRQEPSILNNAQVCIPPKPPWSLVCLNDDSSQADLTVYTTWILWPPFIQGKMQSANVQLRPTPWPSFDFPTAVQLQEGPSDHAHFVFETEASKINSQLLFPWPPPTHRKFGNKIFKLGVQSECKVVISVRIGVVFVVYGILGYWSLASRTELLLLQKYSTTLWEVVDKEQQTFSDPDGSVFQFASSEILQMNYNVIIALPVSQFISTWLLSQKSGILLPLFYQLQRSKAVSCIQTKMIVSESNVLDGIWHSNIELLFMREYSSRCQVKEVEKGFESINAWGGVKWVQLISLQQSKCRGGYLHSNGTWIWILPMHQFTNLIGLQHAWEELLLNRVLCSRMKLMVGIPIALDVPIQVLNAHWLGKNSENLLLWVGAVSCNDLQLSPKIATIGISLHGMWDPGVEIFWPQGGCKDLIVLHFDASWTPENLHGQKLCDTQILLLMGEMACNFCQCQLTVWQVHALSDKSVCAGHLSLSNDHKVFEELCGDHNSVVLIWLILQLSKFDASLFNFEGIFKWGQEQEVLQQLTVRQELWLASEQGGIRLKPPWLSIAIGTFAKLKGNCVEFNCSRLLSAYVQMEIKGSKVPLMLTTFSRPVTIVKSQRFILLPRVLAQTRGRGSDLQMISQALELLTHGKKVKRLTASIMELQLAWDPGGFVNSGLGASRILSGGECHVPGLASNWAEGCPWAHTGVQRGATGAAESYRRTEA